MVFFKGLAPSCHTSKKKSENKKCFLLGVLALCSFIEESINPSVQKRFYAGEQYPMGPQSAFPLFSKVTSALHACRAQWILTPHRQHLLNRAEHLVRAWGHTEKWPYKDNCRLHHYLEIKLGCLEIALAQANTQPPTYRYVKAACMEHTELCEQDTCELKQPVGKGWESHRNTTDLSWLAQPNWKCSETQVMHKMQTPGRKGQKASSTSQSELILAELLKNIW